MSERSFRHLFGFTKDSLSSSSAAAALDSDTPASQQSAGGNDGSGGAGEDAGTGGVAQPSTPPHPGGDSASTDPPRIETARDAANPVPAEPSVRFASPALAVVIPSQGGAPGPSAGDTEVQEVGPPPEPSDSPVVLAGGPIPKYAKHSALNTTPYGPAHSWCRRCVRMITREPQSAGTNYVCSRREHMPCRYCTRGARQQCEEIFPPWFALTDDILSCYRRWAEAPEPARPALAERLREYERTFNQVARDCNLPDAPPKPDRRRRNAPRASSRAVSRAPSRSPSRDRSRSPRAVGPPLRQRSCSPPPVRSSRPSARHARVPSREVHDNHAELVRIMERLMEEARIERMEGPNVGNQATFWGVTRQFFR